MTEATKAGQSRRSLLTRALMLIGGAVGVGAGAGTAAAARRPTPEPATLTLTGRHWLLQGPARKPGERISPGDHSTITGEFVDPRNGKHRGRFVGSRLAFQSGLAGRAEADGSVEMHTFHLDGGTILGMGSTLPGASVFAIVGGTGRYAGAKGSYVARQRLRELGGDGTADFVLNLSA